jgi:hypothetical protein
LGFPASVFFVTVLFLAGAFFAVVVGFFVAPVALAAGFAFVVDLDADLAGAGLEFCDNHLSVHKKKSINKWTKYFIYLLGAWGLGSELDLAGWAFGQDEQPMLCAVGDGTVEVGEVLGTHIEAVLLLSKL